MEFSVFFFQHFEYVVPLLSGLLSYQWENWLSILYVVRSFSLAALNIVFNSLIMVCLGADHFDFILFGSLWSFLDVQIVFH